MKKLSVLFLVFALSVVVQAKDTVIYHTSDTHGFYYAQKDPATGQLRGGFAALAAVLKKGPKNYLLLDSGDLANGTVEAKNSKGLKSVELFNAMHYDAVTIGNHAFDFKDPGVAPMLEKAQFAVLAANFYLADSLKRPDRVEPYKIFVRNGVKIAIIGLANRNPTQATQKYTFTPQLRELENILPEVEKQNPNVVVALVHDSVADDKHGMQGAYVADIARQFPGRVHIVLGGHAHKIIQNKTINGTLFVESGCYTKNVSKITVTTDDKTGRFLRAESELVPLWISKTGQDAAILKIAESLREPGVDEVLGETTAVLPKHSGNPQFLDNALDNWVAEIGKAYTGVDVFITNTGGTRVDMPKGPITKRDIIDIHPFENTITAMAVNGRMLKRIVKSGLSQNRTRFAFAGLTVTFEVNKRGKVKNVQILVNGQPLQNRKQYTIATNSFIAEGRSEGFVFKSIPAEQKKQVGTQTVRGLIENALRAGPVSPVPSGRVQVVK